MSATGGHSDDISEFSHETSSVRKKLQSASKDPRLRNWEHWLERWDEIQNRISRKLDLSPEQLIMHYGDDIKYVNSEKMLLQYAQIPTEFDKYRGKPDFWKLPCALPRRFKCCRNEPDYFAVQTEVEKFIVPTLELVGTPIYIREEKNVLNSARNIYLKWHDSAYRYERMRELKPKILNIMPHRPKFENLILIGTSVSTRQNETLETIKEISSEPKSNIFEVKKKSEETIVIEDLKVRSSSSKKLIRLNLKIDGLLFNTQTTQNDITRKLRINLEYDVTSKKEIVQFIQFDNCGTATLRISWEKLNKFRLFRNYTEEVCHQGFCFNKNDLIILPGSKVILPIWFQSETSGTFSESWKLIATPKIWNDKTQVMLILHCYAYFKDLKDKVNETIQYINIQAKNDTIKRILQEIVDGVKYTDIPIKSCYYGEAQIFETTNLINNKPYYLYNEIIVDELKEIYNELKTEPKTWTFSIKELQNLAHDKDTCTYLENKRLEIENTISKMQSSTREKINLKEKSSSHTKKMGKNKKTSKKDKKEKSSKGSKSKKDKSSKKSKKTPKQISKTSQKSSSEQELPSSEEPKENYIYSNQLKLAQIVKKLESPVIINTKREKYFSCCKVLSAYFTKMCYMLDTLEQENNYKKNMKYPVFKHQLTPINLQPDRMIYEYFEEHYLPKPMIGSYLFSERKPTPKPKRLEGIPTDDVEAVYNSYFKMSPAINKPEVKIKNKTEKHQKGKKDKKKKDNKKKGKEQKSKEKASKAEKKVKKIKSKSNEKVEVEKQISVECFDPYEEIFVYKTENEPESYVSDPLLNPELPKSVKDHYNLLQYVTVYSCLSQAVDAIVDTVESFDCVVSHATLKEVKSNDCPKETQTEKTEGKKGEKNLK